MATISKIAPCLWFNFNAEEAVEFYLTIFKGSIISKSYYWEGSPAPKGALLVAEFELDGQRLLALNAGPNFPFTEAVSFAIDCSSQEEIDFYWKKLCEDGGSPGQCGWLKDKFGLSWQLFPTPVKKLLIDGEPQRIARMMNALGTMTKLDLNQLLKAYNE